MALGLKYIKLYGANIFIVIKDNYFD